MNKFSSHKRLSTTTDVLAFIEELKATKLVINVYDDNVDGDINVELVCNSYDENGSLLEDDDIVIADFIEPRIVEFKRDGQPTVYVECLLDCGNGHGHEVEEDIMAKIPMMKLRVYCVALHNGVVERHTPDDEHCMQPFLNPGDRDEQRMQETDEDADFELYGDGSDDYSIIVNFSDLNYQVVAY